MRRLIYLSSVALIACALALSCVGNKPKEEQKKETTTKSNMELSIEEPADPCGPGGEGTKLIIKNGTPLANQAEPYHITAEYVDGSKVNIELKKMVNNSDGSTSVNLILPGANNENGDPVKFTVTDANGSQTLNFTLVFCL